MTTDEKIRELRRQFAQNERGWRRHWDAHSTMRRELSQRRETRIFRKHVYSNVAFRRLVEYLESYGEVLEFLIRLHVLKVHANAPSDPERAKIRRQKYLQAYDQVQIAARVLRNYIATSSHPEDRKLLTEVAETISHAPALGAADDDGAPYTMMFYDYSLMGQKGNKRGYLIRALDQIVPTAVPQRDAMIRDMLQLLGVSASPQLIRSTLLNGST